MRAGHTAASSEAAYKRQLSKKYGLKGGRWSKAFNEETGERELVYTIPLKKRGRKK